MPGETATVAPASAAAATPAATPAAAGSAGTGAATPASGAGTAAATPAAAAGAAQAAAPAGGSVLGDAMTPAAVLELKTPDGFKLDDKIMGEFKKHALAAGLDSAKAQPFVELGAQLARALSAETDAAQKTRVAEWGNAIKADPVIGGAKFAQSVEDAKQVLAFGDGELKKFFDETGAGNHPAVFRLLVKVGQVLRKSVSEDRSSVRHTETSARGPVEQSQRWAAGMYDSPAMRAATAPRK